MRRLSRFIGRAAFLAALVLLTNALLPLRRHAVGEPRQETAAFHHEDGPGVADDVDQDSPLNPTCNCRHLSNRTFESFGHRSTCGILGDARGPHQKVVSFVVFGQVRKYRVRGRSQRDWIELSLSGEDSKFKVDSKWKRIQSLIRSK